MHRSAPHAVQLAYPAIQVSRPDGIDKANCAPGFRLRRIFRSAGPDRLAGGTPVKAGVYPSIVRSLLSRVHGSIR
jgi:hypothetical protein